MRCPRCEFENMPGQNRCFKCGSVLEIKTSSTDVNPPRMAFWKKPLRSFFRSIRAFRSVNKLNFDLVLPGWLRINSKISLICLLLSVIPGLGHAAQKRFRSIRWCVLAWFICLFGALFFYGGFWGMLYFGFAIGLHAWIIVHCSLLKISNDIAYRFVFVCAIGLALFFAYRYINSIILNDIIVGRSNITIPFRKIKRGDYLLARRSLINERSLIRGDLVLINPESYTRGRRSSFFRTRNGDLMVVQILAFGGEKIEIKDNIYWINDTPLDVEKYPLPDWLHNRGFSAIIPEDKYFINIEYNVYSHGVNPNETIIMNVCVLQDSRFRARVFMRWLPVIRRGFIRDNE